MTDEQLLKRLGKLQGKLFKMIADIESIKLILCRPGVVYAVSD